MAPANKRSTGLGRGLGELFQDTTGAVGQSGGEPAMPDRSSLQLLPIDTIEPNPAQPRQIFDSEQIAELAESIKMVGLLQPIVVRPLDAGRYELVMGERRLRASKEAGLTEIPAIVRPTDEADRLRDALLENLHRVNLNPLEEAAAYQQLLTDFGCTQEELSLRIGRSRPQISNTIRLLKLPAVVQRRVAAGVLSAGHARALLSLDDPAAMERLASRIVAEGLSVRATEEAVAVRPDREAPADSLQQKAATTVADPETAALAAVLSDRYDTRVSISRGQRKGRIVLEFAGDDDLSRLVSLLTQARPDA